MGQVWKGAKGKPALGHRDSYTGEPAGDFKRVYYQKNDWPAHRFHEGYYLKPYGTGMQPWEKGNRKKGKPALRAGSADRIRDAMDRSPGTGRPRDAWGGQGKS